MLAFCWFSSRRPPPQFDLARSGWQRLAAPVTLDAGLPPADCAILADQRWMGSVQRLSIAAASAGIRARTLFLGVESSAERTTLLATGFGDVLPGDADLGEVEQRALRLLRPRDQAALVRRVGPVLLDMGIRDGWATGRRLALHPLEFALLWRLAETPGQVVSRARLLRDVWRISYDPGTNRVEVHISRLRRKLAAADIRGLVETGRDGGYRVVPLAMPTRQLVAGPVPPIARTGFAERGAQLP